MENLFNDENIESIYNILKGDNNQLTKDTLKYFIEKLETNEIIDLVSSPKNSPQDNDTSETISLESFKSIILESKNNKNTNNTNNNTSNQNTSINNSSNINNSNFENKENKESKKSKENNDNTNNTNNSELENSMNDNNNDNSEVYNYLKSGFNLIDNENKGYLNIEDIKKLNKVFKMQFTDDDLEGLFEIASKNESRLSFQNFVDFLINDVGY